MDRRIFLVIIPIVAYFVFSTFHQPNKIVGGDKFFVSEDMGKTWVQKEVRDQGFAFSSLKFLSIAIDPNNSDIIYLGTRGNGLYKSCCRGEHWYKTQNENNLFLERANIYDIAIDSANSDRVYLSVYHERRGRVFRSMDAGESWDEIYVSSEEGHGIFSIAVDKFNPAIIYIGTAQGGFLKSDDYGNSWKIINWFENTISDIAINPFNSNEIYLSAFRGGVYKTIDGGVEWISLKENMEDFREAELIDKIVMDPFNPNVLYTASEYGILTSNDKGETWEEVDMVSPPNAVPALSLAVDSKNTNYLFYGAGSILYNSLDKGKRWIINQLPDEILSVKVIAVDPNNPKLIYVGMHE
ncbi:WD40/YVTN/BNR-like repeat-containing protein [Patescibacteria group bacterium]